MEDNKLSKAERKAYESTPYLNHEDGSIYDITGKTQGIDFEITRDALVTTNPVKVRKIADGRKRFRDGIMLQLDKIDKERATEIRRRGQARQTEVKRQRKNITDICNNLLSISASDLAEKVVNKDIADRLKDTDLTLYDLMVAKMIEESMRGNVKAFAEVRNSCGDKPTDRTELSAEIVTDADREMLRNISERLNG